MNLTSSDIKRLRHEVYYYFRRAVSLGKIPLVKESLNRDFIISVRNSNYLEILLNCPDDIFPTLFLEFVSRDDSNEMLKLMTCFFDSRSSIWEARKFPLSSYKNFLLGLYYGNL